MDQSNPQVRILQGSRVSSKAEIERFQEKFKDRPGFLAGSASNFDAVVDDRRLYSNETDLFGKIRFRMPAEYFASVNLLVGAMGSGKTVFFDNLIAAYPNHHKVIHDPKMGQVSKFYNPAKGDMILGYPDARSVIWDILGDIKKNPLKGPTVYMNALEVIGGESQEKQWNNYATDDLMWMTEETLKRAKDPSEYAGIWLECYEALVKQAGNDSVKTGSLGTAKPVVNLIFQMYHIADTENRRLVTVEDIVKARNVFLCNHNHYRQQLKIINNALLGMLIGEYMSRPNGNKEDVHNLIFLLLDEYITFKLDPDTEEYLFTQSREKLISIWLGIQYLPTDKKQLKNILASNYARIVFSTGDDDTLNFFAESTDTIEYQFYAPNNNASAGGDSLFGGATTGVADNWVPVKRKQIKKEMLSKMTPYVVYMELTINEIGMPKKLNTFLRPIHIKVPKVNPEWVESEAVKHTPFISKFLYASTDNTTAEEVENG